MSRSTISASLFLLFLITFSPSPSQSFPRRRNGYLFEEAICFKFARAIVTSTESSDNLKDMLKTSRGEYLIKQCPLPIRRFRFLQLQDEGVKLDEFAEGLRHNILCEDVSCGMVLDMMLHEARYGL
ncbi:uncharacterized protein A4U43_C09F10280 [Asparagus officinalis]|uniref:Uncharacterized protein n=1 Tax=Asparagus officinalis TaxID=4686 RepID=A0A5P1E9X2_ASPOF|nr:uncharacterized protein A4U43_C09F10280 [Asparagus officinalis]